VRSSTWNSNWFDANKFLTHKDAYTTIPVCSDKRHTFLLSNLNNFGVCVRSNNKKGSADIVIKAQIKGLRLRAVKFLSGPREALDYAFTHLILPGICINEGASWSTISSACGSRSSAKRLGNQCSTGWRACEPLAASALCSHLCMCSVHGWMDGCGNPTWAEVWRWQHSEVRNTIIPHGHTALRIGTGSVRLFTLFLYCIVRPLFSTRGTMAHCNLIYLFGADCRLVPPPPRAMCVAVEFMKACECKL
jgi:hypothetical protein